MNKIVLALLALVAVNAVFVTKRGATDPNTAVYAQLE